MRAGDTSPDYSNSAAIDDPFGFVNVCNTLAKVEVGVFRSANTFELKKGGVFLYIAL